MSEEANRTISPGLGLILLYTVRVSRRCVQRSPKGGSPRQSLSLPLHALQQPLCALNSGATLQAGEEARRVVKPYLLGGIRGAAVEVPQPNAVRFGQRRLIDWDREHSSLFELRLDDQLVTLSTVQCCRRCGACRAVSLPELECLPPSARTRGTPRAVSAGYRDHERPSVHGMGPLRCRLC